MQLWSGPTFLENPALFAVKFSKLVKFLNAASMSWMTFFLKIRDWYILFLRCKLLMHASCISSKSITCKTKNWKCPKCSFLGEAHPPSNQPKIVVEEIVWALLDGIWLPATVNASSHLKVFDSVPFDCIISLRQLQSKSIGSCLFLLS